jgi:hypothetical protein
MHVLVSRTTAVVCRHEALVDQHEAELHAIYEAG